MSSSLQRNPELYKSVPPSPLFDPGSLMESPALQQNPEPSDSFSPPPLTEPGFELSAAQTGGLSISYFTVSPRPLFNLLMDSEPQITESWSASYSDDDNRTGNGYNLVFHVDSSKHSVSAEIRLFQVGIWQYKIYGKLPGSSQCCITEGCFFSQAAFIIERFLKENSNS